MMSVLPFRSCRRPKIHLDLDVIKTNYIRNSINRTGYRTYTYFLFVFLCFFFYIYFSLVCFHGVGRKLSNTVTVAKEGVFKYSTGLGLGLGY